MIVPKNLIASATLRSKRLDKKILARKSFDFTPGVERDTSAEKIARRTKMMGLSGARPSETEFERLIGTNDLVDEFFLIRALVCARAITRLSIRNPSGGERGSATGFMVSPRLLLTNNHVFGSSELAAPSTADFNFRDDIAGNPEISYRHRLRPDLFFYTNKELDFSLVSVAAESEEGGVPLSTWGWLKLIPQSGKAADKDWLTIIQHPGGKRRQFAVRENQCVDDTDTQYLWYLSDTAPGSSGAPVFNDSFQIAALHHSGRARQEKGKYILRNGTKVDSLEGIDDSLIDWIANEGVRISRICEAIFSDAREKEGHLEELRASMESGDVLSNAFQSPPTHETMNQNALPNPQASSPQGVVSIPVLLDLRVNLFGRPLTIGGIATTGASSVASGSASTRDLSGGGILEAYKKPIIDENYTNRKGFDVNFLGVKTELPKLKKAALAAKLKNSASTVVPYEHFSIVVHAQRRLAIFTAANVDWSKKARKPEPGKSYTRDALGGFSKNDDEEWVIDPRVEDAHQVTDNFYRRDKGAFDKGHLVRRDDVCWGASYAEVQRANGDTYHLPNCSPQIAGFNRSANRGDWGLLENFIQAQGKTEKYNVFSGPVLNDEDRDFVGKESTTLTIQVPTKFWKVVAAVSAGKLQTFGFLLEQDLSDVPPGVEFQPTDEWIGKMVSLKQLEAEIGILTFPKSFHTADQK